MLHAHTHTRTQHTHAHARTHARTRTGASGQLDIIPPSPTFAPLDITRCPVCFWLLKYFLALFCSIPRLRDCASGFGVIAVYYLISQPYSPCYMRIVAVSCRGTCVPAAILGLVDGAGATIPFRAHICPVRMCIPLFGGFRAMWYNDGTISQWG